MQKGVLSSILCFKKTNCLPKQFGEENKFISISLSKFLISKHAFSLKEDISKYAECKNHKKLRKILHSCTISNKIHLRDRGRKLKFCKEAWFTLGMGIEEVRVCTWGIQLFF